MEEPVIDIGERRARRRRKRKQNSRNTLIWIVVLIIVLAGSIYGVISFTGSKKVISDIEVKNKKKEASIKELTDNTYLVIGVSGGEGPTKATGIVQFVIDPVKNSIGGLNIPTNTFVEVSGRGFEPVAEGFSQDVEAMIKTIGDFIGVRSNHYLVVDNEHFVSATGEGDLEKLFNLSKNSDIPKDKLSDHIKKINKVKAKNIAIIDLPVRPIAFGEQTYFDPKKDELNRIVKMFWGIKRKEKSGDLRVIILNGNGSPGVARKAADALIGKGFKIIDVKNADKFDYAETQIIIYEKDQKKNADKVQRLLGRGAIALKSMPQDVVDVLIIVGKDFE